MRAKMSLMLFCLCVGYAAETPAAGAEETVKFVIAHEECNASRRRAAGRNNRRIDFCALVNKNPGDIDASA